MIDYYRNMTLDAFDLACCKSEQGRWPTYRKRMNRYYSRKLGRLISVLAAIGIAAPIIQAHA